MHPKHHLSTGFKGFTLIELLVVIAIIGLLSTVIINPVQSARKKARDAKKIAEIKAVQSALEMYADANSGAYPSALSALSPNYIPQLPSFAGTGVPVRDRFAYVQYSGSGGTTQSFSGYHLAVHLESFSPALESDADCTAVTPNTTTPAAGACAATLNSTVIYTYPSWVSGMVGTATNADFAGADTGTTTCSAISDCVFDLANFQ